MTEHNYTSVPEDESGKVGRWVRRRRLFLGGVCVVAATVFCLLYFSTSVKEAEMTNLVPVVQSPDSKQILLQEWKDEERSIIYDWGRETLLAPLNVTDFKTFALRLRFLKDLLQKYETTFETGTFRDLVYPGSKVIYELERSLFPWLHYGHPTIQHLKASFNGPGIVIPTGSHHLKYAVFLIRSLRHLGCTLPICVAYAGENDLKAEEIRYLKRMRVFTMDVAKLVDSKMLDLTGWQIKPFAALVAPFSQVILIDADVVILKDPASILQSAEFQKSHSIIFRDRTLFDKDWKKPIWLEANIPSPLSDKVLKTRMYQTISAHEQESGVVAIDKEHCLFGLLAACKLNAKEERDKVTYKEFYGDKETFWIGMEMAGDSYGVLWPRAGVIGQASNSTKIKGNKKGVPVVCGRILHFDDQGLPFWFNGGIVEDKRDEERRKYLVKFSHYAHEGKWEFEKSCILESPAVPINQTMLDSLSQFGKLWRPSINLDETPNI